MQPLYGALCTLNHHHAVLVPDGLLVTLEFFLQTLHLLHMMSNLIFPVSSRLRVVLQSTPLKHHSSSACSFWRPHQPPRWSLCRALLTIRSWSLGLLALPSCPIHRAASEPHLRHQRQGDHGCQGCISPVAGSVASLPQLHFLNTFVWSLTKVTDFLSHRGWPLETTSHCHGLNYFLKGPVLQEIHSALNISLPTPSLLVIPCFYVYSCLFGLTEEEYCDTWKCMKFKFQCPLIKLYWNSAMCVHFSIFYGWFHTTKEVRANGLQNLKYWLSGPLLKVCWSLECVTNNDAKCLNTGFKSRNYENPFEKNLVMTKILFLSCQWTWF